MLPAVACTLVNVGAKKTALTRISRNKRPHIRASDGRAGSVRLPRPQTNRRNDAEENHEDDPKQACELGSGYRVFLRRLSIGLHINFPG